MLRVAGMLLALWTGVAAAGGAQADAATCPPPIPFDTPVQAAEAAPAPRDRGLLWRLQRDGRTSWLYGTLHLGRPAWTRPGPQVAAALAAVDVLAVELDLGDPAVVQAMAHGASAAGPGAALPPGLAAALRDAAERACLPAAALATLHPVLQAGTLTLAEGRWLGLDAAWSQEALLLAQARQRGLRVVSLEQPAQQIQALVPADDASAQQVVSQSLQQLRDGSARRVLATLAAAWEAGDLQRLADYEDWCECAPTAADRAFLQRLNDGRNDGLAAGIAARHAAGDRVFAAVGALHMTGPRALPALLAAQGFEVVPVVPAPPAVADAPEARRTIGDAPPPAPGRP